MKRAARDAELRLEAVERERDRLAARVDALIARIPANPPSADEDTDNPESTTARSTRERTATPRD